MCCRQTGKALNENESDIIPSTLYFTLLFRAKNTLKWRHNFSWHAEISQAEVIKCVWNNEKVFRWHKESRTKTAWPYERQDYRVRPDSTHSQQVIPRKQRKTGQHKWTTGLWRPGTASRISSPVCVCLRQDTQNCDLSDLHQKKKNNMVDGRDVAAGRNRRWLVWKEQAHVQMNELGRGIPAIEELVGKRLIWLE